LLHLHITNASPPPRSRRVTLSWCLRAVAAAMIAGAVVGAML
jgi:hypothetical protein